MDLIQDHSDRKYWRCQLGRRPDWQSAWIGLGEWQALGERTPRIEKRACVCELNVLAVAIGSWKKIECDDGN